MALRRIFFSILMVIEVDVFQSLGHSRAPKVAVASEQCSSVSKPQNDRFSVVFSSFLLEKVDMSQSNQLFREKYQKL